VKTPIGDRAQLFEDLVAWNATEQRRATTPEALKEFLGEVARGEAFLMPWNKKGPINFSKQTSLFR
jgi:hypothetical protein